MHIMLDEDGIPRTINRFVKVNMIALKHQNGDTPAELAEHYGITLADVYAALAYYHDNRPYFEARRRYIESLPMDNVVDGAAFRAEVEARMRKMRGE